MSKKSSENTLYRTQIQKLKHLNINEFIACKALCRYAKNMYNMALYNVRQYYFEFDKYLNYYETYSLLKNDEIYKFLGAKTSQNIMQKVDENFSSFFSLIKLKKQGLYDAKVKIPKYLDKNGFFVIEMDKFSIDKNGLLKIYMSKDFEDLYGKVKIKVPNNLLNVNIKIKSISLVPKYDASYFELHYTYVEKETQNKKEYILEKNKFLGIDLGVNNLCTCVTNGGDNFIIDGKYLKSINQFANKQSAYYRSLINKQGLLNSKKINSIWSNRNNKIEDYLNKSVNYIINYCLDNNIGNIILGYNKNIQDSSNLGKVNNQNFVNIPISKINTKLRNKCIYYGINFIEQEESYTSKASFIDNDDIPVYGKLPKDKNGNNITPIFSGKRVYRGLYKTKNNFLINADVNGALNIMRKSNIVKFDDLDTNKLKQNKILKILQVA